MKINQIEPFISENESKALSSYLSSGGWLTEFKKTKEFEKKIANYVGAKHSVIVPSGTTALYLSLLSIGIGPGDFVAVPNYTMIASINAIKWTGAEPIICDVDPYNLCLDLNSLAPHLNKLKAIIYVQINGRSGDMREVVDFCNNNNLLLIEDSAQAMGSCFKNKFFGTFGDLGVYSLTPHKIITTGQGGVIVTNNSSYYSKVCSLKDFSRIKPGVDIHNNIGYNFKFTDLQSVVGIEQMNTIEFRVNKKRKIYNDYFSNLKSIDQIEFFDTDLSQVTPWAIDIVLKSKKIRDGLADFLGKKSVGTRVFYPALNSQKPYAEYKKGSFPVSESISERGLWLPSSIGLSNIEIDFVCENITEYFTNLD
jgi:perosamine synthetase